MPAEPVLLPDVVARGHVSCSHYSVAGVVECHELTARHCVNVAQHVHCPALIYAPTSPRVPVSLMPFKFIQAKLHITSFLRMNLNISRDTPL